MGLKTLISECTTCDFKVMLEEKKPKSWLKSVSAFANGLGGSLFFGLDNDGIPRGLDDVQYVCETISSKIRDYMDPLPDVEMIPHDMNGLHILQLKVNAGHYTPYYYVGDNQRIAFVRIGDESVPATAEQMVRLVLKGSNKTFDSLHTDYKAENYSFAILANAFKDRTKQEWNKKYLLSFGLVTGTKTPTQFHTIIFASSDAPNVGDHDRDVSETKLTERQQKILDLIHASPTISGHRMSETLSVSQRTIERDLSTLKKMKILKREGKDNNGFWRILTTIG